MSDFDKEAERERLREKYGEQDDDPTTAEEMSELLLKGATMTNAHCSQCGDPIFRYDGQEFCPTCKQPVERADGATADPSAADGSEAANAADESPDGADAADQPADRTEATDDQVPGDHIEVTTPSDEATVRFGGDDGTARADDPQPDSDARSAPEPANSSDTPGSRGTSANCPAPGDSPTDQSEGAEAAQGAGRTEHPSERQTPPAPPRSDARAEADAGRQPSPTADALGSARGRLARVVDRYAAAAEAADDPRTAREYLETARAAAEALDATQF